MTARWAEFGGRRWELADHEVSLTYDAARRAVTRHASGRSEVIGDDLWTALAEHLTEGVTAVGYLGYACRRDLPALVGGDVPDAVVLLARASAPAPSRPAESGPQVTLARTTPPAGYAEAFAEVQEALHAGHSYETNLTYRLTVESRTDPMTVHERLLATNPAPYAGMLQHDVPGARAWLVSSSPERYARIEDGWIETKPIKGTTPRAADPAEDAANAERLAGDPKYRSENLMITDLLRNDLAMVCDPGTVRVPSLMAVESYASVHQLVTTVRGRLRTGVTPLAAVHALFPAGSMTGAPKLRTMEVIERVEDTPRGAYAGAFGRITGTDADLGVVIRSLTTAGDGRWTLGTGGGITVRSDAADELAESQWKAERLLAALDAPVPTSARHRVATNHG